MAQRPFQELAMLMVALTNVTTDFTFLRSTIERNFFVKTFSFSVKNGFDITFERWKIYCDLLGNV